MMTMQMVLPAESSSYLRLLWFLISLCLHWNEYTSLFFSTFAQFFIDLLLIQTQTLQLPHSFESSRYCSAFTFSPKPLPEAPNIQPSGLPALEGWSADLTGKCSLLARWEFSLSPLLISVTRVSAFPLHWSVHLFWRNTPWSASWERDLQFWDLHPLSMFIRASS